MRPLLNIIGVILVILGIVVLGYHGFSYTKSEKVAQIGDIQLTADTKKNVYVPPIVGGLCFAAGIIIIIANRINKK
jgi:hypothetical protein